MDCSCSIDCGWDSEPATLLSSRQPKAKKTHVCCECRRTIKPGEKYQVESLVSDGQFWSHKMCFECKEIREVFFTTWVYGALWTDLEETYRGELPPGDCMRKLSKSTRDMVCDCIEACWEDE